jgi:hypothetical protein
MDLTMNPKKPFATEEAEGTEAIKECPLFPILT